MGSKVYDEREHTRMVEAQDELRSWAARLHRKNHCGSALPAEPEPPPSLWVRAVVWAGIPAIAALLALFPWTGIVAPPGLVVQAIPELSRPQATAPPPSDEQRSASAPAPEVRLPVAPTAPPATPTPTPTPVPPPPAEPSPAATPTPTVKIAVGTTPAPTTPTPTPSPAPAPPPLPTPSTPAVTPTASPAPEPSSIPRCLGRIFLICPPQG